MTKIDIFSGFLGAGKTTLIKKLIKESFAGQKVVLIENEFGEIGIDGGFLKESGIQINELNAGCICCSLVGDFRAALQQVVEQYHPDHRTGIMFKETSVGETKVFYYRENSAASHLCPEDVTPALLDGVKILHMSGITPVLSESCLEMTKAAFALAKEKGVAISFDPNIRRKLWHGQDYAPLIRELTQQSEIVLLGLDEAEALFGLRDPDAIFDLLFRDGCAQYVAIKDGGNGAWVADKTTREKLPPYPCKPIEPIGAGDGFNAGFLAGILQGRDAVTSGRMGAVCGALATQTPGDVEGYPDAIQMEAALTGAAITYR